MRCDKCGYEFLIKSTDNFVSLLCKCKIIIFYPDSYVTIKEKEEYKKEWK